MIVKLTMPQKYQKPYFSDTFFIPDLCERNKSAPSFLHMLSHRKCDIFLFIMFSAEALLISDVLCYPSLLCSIRLHNL